MAVYELYLADTLGNRFTTLDSFIALRWVRVVNDVGYLTISFAGGVWQSEWFAKDNRIELWRGHDAGKPPRLENVYFMRGIRHETQGALKTVTVSAADPVYLLTSRNYRGSKVTDNLDDAMKTIVKACLGSTAGTGRDLTSYGFTVEADVSLGPSATVTARGLNLLKGLQNISLASRQAGTPVYFDVVAPSPSTLEFRTFKTLRGKDRSFAASNNPHLLSVENESLQDPALWRDYLNEVTYIYGGGGNGVAYAGSDTTRINESPFGRREAIYTDNKALLVTTLTSGVNAALRAGQPAIHFTGKLLETEGFIYGVDWEIGDKVTASYADMTFDVEIRGLDVTLDGDGLETLTGKLVYESA